MISEYSLEGEVAIVTGASRSIGRGIATVLAEAGADILLCGRSKEDLDNVAGEVEAIGRKGIPVICDVTDRDAVAAMIATCKTELGTPTIAVANAGVFQEWGPAKDVPPEEWDKVIDIDLTGVWHTCQLAGREMIADEGGSIVTISSISSLASSGLAVSARIQARKQRQAGTAVRKPAMPRSSSLRISPCAL